MPRNLDKNGSWKGDRALLLKLYKKHDGWCAYCGTATIVQESGEHKQKDNTATIEHLYGLQDLRRYTKAGDKAVILACHKCNSSTHKRPYIYRRYLEDQEFSLISLLLK